jgi:pimeloyl-ACP methyl ester carboxylesterase
MKRWLSILFWFSIPFLGYGQDGFIEGQPQLAYWQLGNKPQTVIVLHGGPGLAHHYLRPEFDALQQTARVIYFDQRGCGQSDTASSYVWQEYVADLKRLIQTLAPHQKVFLAGSTWGSSLAILYTYTYPDDVKGLILTGPVKWRGQEQPYVQQGLVHGKPDRQALLKERRLIRKPRADGTVQTDTIEVQKLIDRANGSPQLIPYKSMISAPKAERLKRIRAPIQMISGNLTVNPYNQPEFNRKEWVEEYIKVFTQLELHVFNEAVYEPWFSNPDLFFSLSNRFIQRESAR